MSLVDEIFNNISINLTQKEEMLLKRKLKEDNGCVIWTGAKNAKGYGHARFRDKILLSHRLMYKIVHTNIPDEKLVCHTCDNPACCFVTKTGGHLFLGTPKENSVDCATKNRFQRNDGESNPNCKIPDIAVLEIIKCFSNGISTKILANKYNVHPVTITNILTGKSRNSVTRIQKPIKKERKLRIRDRAALMDYLINSPKLEPLDIARFNEKTLNVGDCTIWQRKLNKEGYGSFSFKGFSIAAHQFAFITKFGRLPRNGLEISHTCANSACVNPEHLVEATRTENMNNSVTKLRYITARNQFVSRQDVPRNKISSIRERLAAGETTIKLAEEYGVSDVTISKIGRGETHKDLPGPLYELGSRKFCPKGELSGLAKITESDVFEIRCRMSNGEKALDIAKEKGISRKTVDDIAYGRTWSHLNPTIDNYIAPLVSKRNKS